MSPAIQMLKRCVEMIDENYEALGFATRPAFLAEADALIAAETPQGPEAVEDGLPGPVVPTKRCPICWTYGHTHRKGCHYERDGMLFHIPLSYKEKPK